MSHRPPCTDGNVCGEAAHCPPELVREAFIDSGIDLSGSLADTVGLALPGHDLTESERIGVVIAVQHWLLARQGIDLMEVRG